MAKKTTKRTESSIVDGIIKDKDSAKELVKDVKFVAEQYVELRKELDKTEKQIDEVLRRLQVLTKIKVLNLVLGLIILLFIAWAMLTY